MKYWIVTGLKGPRFKEQLQKTLERVSARREVIPVVVCTGDVTWEGAGVALREDREGVFPFLLKAFEHLRQEASWEDWFVRLDADDYYGSGYLDSVEEQRQRGADATGIASIYTRDEQGQLYFLRSRRSTQGDLVAGAPGGTLAGSMRVALDFPKTPWPWGEDTMWCDRMRAAGARMTTRTPAGYVMQRWAGHEHTYPVAGLDLPHFWNHEAFQLGGWDELLVNREFDEETAQRLEKDSAAELRGYFALKKASRIS